jgi:hypothetical protein
MKGNPEERQTEIPVPSPSSPNRHNHDTHPTVKRMYWHCPSLVDRLIGGLNNGQLEMTIRRFSWNRTTIPEPAGSDVPLRKDGIMRESEFASAGWAGGAPRASRVRGGRFVTCVPNSGAELLSAGTRVAQRLTRHGVV